MSEYLYIHNFFFRLVQSLRLMTSSVSLISMTLISHFKMGHESTCAVNVLPFSHLEFLLCHIQVCLHLIILFNSSLSLLEWHSAITTSPVAPVLPWQPFLTVSVFREPQMIIFFMTFLPGTMRENIKWNLAAFNPTCGNDCMVKQGREKKEKRKKTIIKNLKRTDILHYCTQIFR